MRLQPRDGPSKRAPSNRRHRALDLAIVLPALIICAPVIATAAVAVRWRMGSPVLFRQERAGLDGRPFTVLKLRTMSNSSLDVFDSAADEDRLTPLGAALRRWSLDELPQLWNVARGEMSVVGPRPLPVSYVGRYSEPQRRRLTVRPGITGLAQVSGRNGLSWPRKFELDLEYIERRSLRLDISIIVRTCLSLITGRGISANGVATMPEFRGERGVA